MSGRRISPVRRKIIKQEKQEAKEFVKLMVFLPRDAYDIITAHSKRTGLKMSRAVAIALDNELDTAEPFTYHCDIPESVSEIGKGGHAQRILDWLSPFVKGVSVDTLVLCRRSLDLSKSEVLEAIRFLVDKGWVELVQKNKYYDEVYPTVRIKKEVRKELKEKGLLGRSKDK